MFEIIGKTSIDFIGWRRYSFALFSVLVILGIIAVVQIARGAANLGIDFTGTAIQLTFDLPVSIELVRAELVHRGWSNVELQDIMTENKVYVMESSTKIGPTIGQKLQRDALLAITLSIVGIVVYIASRFEFRFGVAAAIATLHDAMAVLGIFYLLDKEITLLLVTALLTLAGYSLTDTVVIFDRIRESQGSAAGIV